jgi:hypothetical protein
MTTTGVMEAPEREKTFFGQPRVLANLFRVELWEGFYEASKGGLGIGQATATSIVGAYGGLVYLSTILGAWLADRLLGSERVLFYSAIVVMAGQPRPWAVDRECPRGAQPAAGAGPPAGCRRGGGRCRGHRGTGLHRAAAGEAAGHDRRGAQRRRGHRVLRADPRQPGDHAGRTAPGGRQMVALFFLSVALGTAMAGALAKYYSENHEAAYFGTLGAIAIVLGGILAALTPMIRRLMGGVH